METFIPSTSPLFQYTPCNNCDPSIGFTSSPNNTVLLANAPNASIAINFTGTSISFLLDNPSTSTILIDGQTPVSPVNITNTSVTNIPYGAHEIKLVLDQPSGGDGIRFLGVNGGMGSLYTAQSENHTVDDTAWRDWKVALSPAWNMLEKGASNWVNTTQFNAELQTAKSDFNESISWTEQANASTTITFNGSAVWAFGITGEEHGSYEVLLNNRSQGVFNASGGPRSYQSILYHSSGLSDGIHNLTLRNLEQGKRLSFDFVNSTSGLLPVPDTASGPPPLPPVPTLSSGSSSSILNTGTIVAIALSSTIAAIVLIILLVLGVKRARRKPEKEKEPSIKPLTTFWRWSNPNAAPSLPPFEKSRPFQPLPSPPVSASHRIAPFSRWPSPPLTDGSIYSPQATQTSFLKLSKSPSRKTFKPPRTDSAASNHPPSERSRQGEFLDMGTIKPKSRMHIPFFEKTKFPEDKPRNSVNEDLPSPRFSHALAAAVNGQTTSPLSELRDSYFPSMKPKATKKKRKGSTGSVSIHTDFTGLDEWPITPSGILDGYGTDGVRGHQKNNAGKSMGWTGILNEGPGARV